MAKKGQLETPATEATETAPEEQGRNQQEAQEILSEATSSRVGLSGLKEWNPMESIPTYAVGEEIKEGTEITAYFVKNEVIASQKFTHSKTRNAEGIPTQIRHVFRSVKTGKLFAVWTCGELKVMSEKLAEGELVSFKYLRKGVNAKNQAQHFFSYEKGSINQSLVGLGANPVGTAQAQQAQAVN